MFVPYSLPSMSNQSRSKGVFSYGLAYHKESVIAEGFREP